MIREEFITGLEDVIQLLYNEDTQKLAITTLKKMFGTKKNISCHRYNIYNSVNDPLEKRKYFYRLTTRSMKSTVHCLHHIIKHNCTIMEVRPRNIDFNTEEHDFSNVSYND